MVKTSSDPITVISLFLHHYHISRELEEDDISSFDGDTRNTAYSLFWNTLTKGSGVLCHSSGHTGSLEQNRLCVQCQCTCVQLPGLGLEVGLLGVPDLCEGASPSLSGEAPARVQHQILH